MGDPVDVGIGLIEAAEGIHVFVGDVADWPGRQEVEQVGLVNPLGIGLFFLGLGWSFTLIAGSTLLSASVDDEMRPSSQGTSDLIMNLMGAAGGALAGVIIGFLNYGWLCYFASLPVIILGVWSYRLKRTVV